jgi:phosphatidylglycerol:prolipoprotein diacylglycerol transferase
MRTSQQRKTALIQYPNISPVLVQLGPLQIRWYGLMYIIGFALGYLVLKKRAQEMNLNLDKTILMDFAFYLFVGVLVGGRVGYILFYNPLYFASHLPEVLALWQGGMSFHGGLIGSILAGFFFCWKQKIDFYQMADAVIPAVPIGLGLGRLGNFINGELWGRQTDAPWAMVFPMDPDQVPRHPSQLYEFAMEGVVLFTVLWLLRKLPLPKGTLFWVFIALYGTFRTIAEAFREPDVHLAFIFPNITAGMVLSLPMMVMGVIMIVLGFARERRTAPPSLQAS